MNALAISGVSKRFGHTVAVRDVTLEVGDGEIGVLLGPSGCGKSTLLRIVAGLEGADAGTIAIGGRDVTRLEPRERDVAMVFQHYALYPHMTVRQNLAFPLEVRGAARATAAEAVGRAARTLGLDALLDRRPAELSGGQRQRVAIGRAIVRRPALFLFDEPLSNLDAQLRAQMRAELSALFRDLGAAVLYVTHDQVEAMTLGHRIALMKDGGLEQVGTPAELYDTPRTTFAAGFIGTPPMNLVAASGPSALPISDVPADAAHVGVRPEDLAIDAGGPWTGRVTLVENLGADALVHVAACDVRLIVRQAGRAAVAPGTPVRLRPARLHFYDRAGRRLPDR